MDQKLVRFYLAVGGQIAILCYIIIKGLPMCNRFLDAASVETILGDLA